MHCLAASRVVLIILRQPPIPAQPAKRPFHDPPPLVDLECRLTGMLTRNLQHPPTHGAELEAVGVFQRGTALVAIKSF
jgi:hypothetical protein